MIHHCPLSVSAAGSKHFVFKLVFVYSVHKTFFANLLYKFTFNLFTTEQMTKNESETIIDSDLPLEPRWYNHVSLLHGDLHSSAFPLAIKQFHTNTNTC